MTDVIAPMVFVTCLLSMLICFDAKWQQWGIEIYAGEKH
jgi:hypothetical protein